MKCKVSQNEGFRPVTMTITMESLTDVAFLWAAFNCSVNTMRKNCENVPEIHRLLTEASRSPIDPLWDHIDAVAQSNNLKRR